MCMHVKEGKVKGAVTKELRLLRKAILLTEMSIASNCLQCIRMGGDSRYVSPKSIWSDPDSIMASKIMELYEVHLRANLVEPFQSFPFVFLFVCNTTQYSQ